MTRIAVRRIMKILGIITIVALLLGSEAVAPVAATEGLQSASMPPDEATPDSDSTANINSSEQAL